MSLSRGQPERRVVALVMHEIENKLCCVQPTASLAGDVLTDFGHTPVTPVSRNVVSEWKKPAGGRHLAAGFYYVL
jgi:hypothetical protein